MALPDRARNEDLRNAYSLHQAGRLAEAAHAYGAIVAADPKQFDARFLLGLVHLQSGRLQDAARMLEEASALNPASIDALSARTGALQQLGRTAEALACTERLIALKPDDAFAWNNRGNLLLALNRAGEALASYDRALALKADYPEAWHNRAVTLMLAQNYREAETDLNRALSLKPDYAEALEHLGVAVAAQGRHQDALASYDSALAAGPPRAELMFRRGDSLLHMNRFADAVSGYDRGLGLMPNNAEAWHNRGVALSRMGRLQEALESYGNALSLQPGFAAAWHNRGSVLLELKDHAAALESYDKALALQPDYAEAWKSRGVLLTILQDYGPALEAFDRTLAFNREDADAWLGRANVLSRLERNEHALPCYDEALRLRPDDLAALFNRANIHSLLKHFEESARDCRAVLERDPDYPYARGLLMHARLHACDWQGLQKEREEIARGIHDGNRVINPFGYLAISNAPDDELQCARILVNDLYPASPTRLWQGEPYRHYKIRIAYLSADFYEHATAFLMAGVFEHHDRSRFETTAISFGPDDRSAMRTRLEAAFDRFLDVRADSDAAVAAKLRELEIDIAVDLKGYTGGARAGILARRPAPLQIHYLGYPGSMGASYIDYLLADRIVVPDEDRAFYTDRIACLPDSYQCNDSRRAIAERTPSRAEAGLPEEGFVFCCFNSQYKILPDIFDIWMRLLERVGGSVLWLFAEYPGAAANLRREAQARGIAAERLIFAKRMPLDQHLARLQLADLALDTLPYGAHTTASDALWAGVPILTCLGRSFAGRVAASLLTTMGLPGLITPSLAAYEARALELAADRSALGPLKAKLAANRKTSPLFDTARMTRHLEAAYREMWERQQRGEPPAGFSVEPARASLRP